MSLKVLVIGSGGREHALVHACLNSPKVARVVALPGNGGMAQDVHCQPIPVENTDAIVAYAREEAMDFVLCGPEVPLSLGLADALRRAGIPTYGPGQLGAQLEASKAFCKDFLHRHHIPTAAFATFSEIPAALDYLKTQEIPVVIKASGLAAGKGVVIAESREQAEYTIREMLSGAAFGASGTTIVIEEYMEGEEASLHIIVSDGQYLMLPMSQDHKRIGDGDSGPNTGGMGAYAPTGAVKPDDIETVKRTIIEPTLRGLEADEIPYRGTLYIGLMLTQNGPKVVEFNVRFGDPETQVLLPMVATDLIPILYRAACGESLPETLPVQDGYSIVVVLAAEGYPGAYRKGDAIDLPSDKIGHWGESCIYHAGTTRDSDGTIRTAGGRVLGVTGMGINIGEARNNAYTLCEKIAWPGKIFRSDIAHRELARIVS